MAEKIILGLSGGVDSAVAARLLRERGFDVHGLFLDIGGGSARKDAQAVADCLEIPLAVKDISAELEKNVCKPFAEAYLCGKTPNPCIMCNPTVKFKALCEFADELGAKKIATGHYARTKSGKLYKGMPSNDQSYMLCRLTPKQVERLVLPLGELSKKQIRALAADMDLPVANKPDSMEICFIPDGDYGRFIERRGIVPPKGNFVDAEGNVLGRHRGIHRYTVGQRRGLGIAMGRRIFVSEIRPDVNEVVLSDGDVLMTGRIFAEDVNWISMRSEPFAAEVKVRHSKVQTPAVVEPLKGGAGIVFEVPVRAPTVGQSAVFYVDDELIGGGYIV